MPISKPASTACISALVFQLFVFVFAAQVWPLSSSAQNTYTSPIDITGMKLQMRAVAPDRETGRPVNVAIPLGLLGPQMNQLFSMALSSQFDQYWSGIRDPKNGLTQREQVCNQLKQEIKKDAAGKLPGGMNVYVACDFAPTGKLLAKQHGTSLSIGYLLISNKVTVALTTPATCQQGHGTPFCPNDPTLIATFAAVLTTTADMPDLCHLSTQPVTVLLQSVHTETGGIAAPANFFDDLFRGGQDFAALNRAISSYQQQKPSPLVGPFAELANSDGCKNRNPVASTALEAFSNFETLIERDVILQITHRGIQPPLMDATLSLPAQRVFTHPTISVTQPTVAPGSTVTVNGIYFPANNSYMNTLPVRFVHYGYAGASALRIGKGPCFGGATELQITPVNGQPRIERLPADVNGVCVAHDDAKNLIPGTTYQFRARDCDPITCSSWTAPQKASTDPAAANKGAVSFTIDGGTTGGCGKFKGISCKAAAGTQIGSAIVNPQGTFVANVTIPTSISPGSHTIRAFNGDASAELPIVVAAASGALGAPSLMLIAPFPGETGCPNHPTNSFQTGANLTLFGKGFSAGAISIHLDAANAPVLGTVTAAADGTFCGKIPGPQANQTGTHKLVAVQSGTVRAQLAVNFVQPMIVH